MELSKVTDSAFGEIEWANRFVCRPSGFTKQEEGKYVFQRHVIRQLHRAGVMKLHIGLMNAGCVNEEPFW
jgi:hypothetical protein